MARDFYEVLGISKSSSPEEIKVAYRKLSKELHPDKHSSTGSGQVKKDAEQKFKEVNEAYEVLSNPKKKQMYDQFGKAGMNGGQGHPGAGGGFSGFDFSSFTRGQGGDFSDLFETFFGGTKQTHQSNELGRDREVEIAVDFSAVIHGEKRELAVRKFAKCAICDGKGTAPGSSIVNCNECHGTGTITRVVQSLFGTIQQQYQCPKCKGSGKIPEKPCPTCSGEGRTQQTVRVTINIPAGISSGQVLRVRGAGDAGPRGKSSGDLYVGIRVKADPHWERDGDDVHTLMTISVLDAMLGAEKSVDTVEGAVTLKIPEGTQPGQVFRLRGKGLPVLSTSRRGDQYVKVEVEIPKKLSRAERKVVEEWKKLHE